VWEVIQGIAEQTAIACLEQVKAEAKEFNQPAL
jgi:hypothetical protein